MIPAVILIGDWGWLPATICIVIAAGLLLFLSYRMLTAPPFKIRFCAAVLKAAGVTILAVCLVEPLWSSVRARTGANIFLLLADNSQSMQIRDAGKSRSRGDELKGLFRESTQADRPKWHTRLGQEFDIRHYSFGTHLKQKHDFSTLDFHSTGSSIHGMLEAIREQFKGSPMGGAFLFTDGNATDLADIRFELAGLPPIFPILIGSERSLKDISIQNVSVTETAFEDAPVSIRIDVATRGYAETVCRTARAHIWSRRAGSNRGRAKRF